MIVTENDNALGAPSSGFPSRAPFISARWMLLGACVILAVFVVGLWKGNRLPPSSFKAFYCAGQVVDRGADPYRVEPLRICEHQIAPLELPAYAVEPAPFPGYVIDLWALLARTAYPKAHLVYLLLSVAALGAIAFSVSELSGIPAVVVLLAFLSLWFLNISYGEVPPLSVAGIALCAYFLRTRAWWFSAVCAAIAVLEPQLGAPLWLALLLFVPQMRLPLVTVGIALLGADVAMGGPARALAYFSHVIPLQALSEVHANDQFSLTHVLSFFGMSDALALRIGSLSYVIMLTIGVAVAVRMYRTVGAVEYLALAPPAFVLLGGTFGHDLQFITALPLALVLFAGNRSGLLALATLLLCIPWTFGSSRLADVFICLSVAAVFWIYAENKPWLSRVAFAGVSLFAVVLAILLNARSSALPSTPLSAGTQIYATDWAPLDWRIYLQQTPGRTEPSPSALLYKLPTWFAIILLLTSAVAQATRSDAMPDSMGLRQVDA
jgi:hypothetical protein